jgi:hypothetical protein
MPINGKPWDRWDKEQIGEKQNGSLTELRPHICCIREAGNCARIIWNRKKKISYVYLSIATGYEIDLSARTRDFLFLQKV